ncbi:MAG TPA: hypothetical protein VFY99_10885 [Solirubrobacterales bacterium]
MNSLESNGGFPEPPEGDPVRIVRAAHASCGAETRIRLPGYLPSRTVRRVVCDECRQAYDADAIEEENAGSDPTVASSGEPPVAGNAAPPATPTRRARLPQPSSRLWTWVGIPVAAVAVVAGLILLQGGEDPSPTVTVGAPGTPAAPEASSAQGDREAASGAAAGDGADSGARFVTQPGYSLALPPGWEQTPAEGGAAFTAASTDGTADATLWIERAPDLSFAEFETRSLEQLRSLTGNAEVLERIPAPTAAGTVVRLRADTPEGTGVSAPYDVTLRAAGPYRYYLATTVQPGASRQASEGADLIHGSFVPEPEGGGEIETGAAPGSDDAAAPEGAATPAEGEAP